MPATPFCWATRPLLALSWPTLPTRWAPMARALTGVHRFQPSLATRPVSPPASAAAAFRATALARVPPNQADRPRSCSERDRVLRATGELLGSSVGIPSYPSAPDSRRSRRLDRRAVALRRPGARLLRLDLAVLGRSGGDQGVEQPCRGLGDLGDRPVEGLGVHLRRAGAAADLAHVLEGG